MTARTLVILRHAKAETPDAPRDFERSLTTRGQNDSDAAGSWLASQGLVPDLVLCSPATRTRQTWHGVAVALNQVSPTGGTPEVHYEHTLYDGGRSEVIDLLRAVSDTIRTVLVVGHNPTVSDVSILLQPGGSQFGMEALRTCGLAVHRPSGAWSDTEPGSAELVQRHTARA